MVQLSLSDEDKPDEFSSECCPKINGKMVPTRIEDQSHLVEMFVRAY